MEKGSFIVAAGSFCRQRKKQGNLRLFGRLDLAQGFRRPAPGGYAVSAWIAVRKVLTG
jgi:hypothetical protein